MSRPRYWWYYNVKQITTRSLRGQISSDTMAGSFVNTCVKAVYERTREREDGDRRCRAVDMAMVKGRYRISGVAMRLHVSERVVVQYISDFVYDVAKEMGFYSDSGA